MNVVALWNHLKDKYGRDIPQNIILLENKLENTKMIGGMKEEDYLQTMDD